MHITHAGLDESEAQQIDALSFAGQPNLQLDKCIMNKLTNTLDYITHSIIRLVIISIFLSGCTNLNPIDINSKTLHDNIRSGELFEEGDRVRVITKDGSSHILKVTAISEHVLMGQVEGTGTPRSWTGSEDGMYMEAPATEPTVIEIMIDDIVLLEEEKISAGKTTLAVGGGIVAVAAIAFTILIVSFTTADWSTN